MLFPAYEYNAQLLYATTPLTACDARLTAPQRLACLSCAAATKRSTCLALNAVTYNGTDADSCVWVEGTTQEMRVTAGVNSALGLDPSLHSFLLADTTCSVRLEFTDATAKREQVTRAQGVLGRACRLVAFSPSLPRFQRSSPFSRDAGAASKPYSVFEPNVVMNGWKDSTGAGLDGGLQPETDRVVQLLGKDGKYGARSAAWEMVRPPQTGFLFWASSAPALLGCLLCAALHAWAGAGQL